MESFFRRRRRLLVGVAAGAAGALAAFYWYTGYAKNKLEQQRSVEAELTAILRGESQSGAAGGDDGEEGEGGEEGDECGSPDLDESLDSHFNYIQKVSAPQELTNLLPRVQETLFRLTDVTLVKQLQLQQQQQQAVAQQPQQRPAHEEQGSADADLAAAEVAVPVAQPSASPAADRSSSGGGSCASSGGSTGSSAGGAGGAVSRKASLAAAAVAAMQPRPLARCLRAVQGACDPLFVDAREVTARIACLQPVMSLCAVAFAAPLEL